MSLEDKLIPYWCSGCGNRLPYPDCGVMSVYMNCKCEHRPVLFYKNKLLAIKHLNSRRGDIIASICKLTGIKFESLFQPAPKNPGQVFCTWIDKEEKKQRKRK